MPSQSARVVVTFHDCPGTGQSLREGVCHESIFIESITDGTDCNGHR